MTKLSIIILDWPQTRLLVRGSPIVGYKVIMVCEVFAITHRLVKEQRRLTGAAEIRFVLANQVDVGPICFR